MSKKYDNTNFSKSIFNEILRKAEWNINNN